MLVSTRGTLEPGSGDGDGTGDSTGGGWSAEVDVEPSGSVDVDVGGMVGWDPAPPVPALVASAAPALGLAKGREPGVEAADPHAMSNINAAATISNRAEPPRGRIFTVSPFPLINYVLYFQ